MKRSDGSWGPVGMGYLTGKLEPNFKFDAKTDLRSGFDRFTSEALAANLPIIDLLKQMAGKKNATPHKLTT